MYSINPHNLHSQFLNLKGHLLTFNTHIILASSYHEVSVLSPLVAVAVSDDPVLGVVSGIDSPAKQDDGVVEVGPCFPCVIEGLV